MKTEHQRGIGTPRFPRIVDNHQTGQQRKPFFTGERIHPHMPGFHHKDRGCIHPHLFEQFFGRRILQHLYTILTEYFSPEQTDRFIGISRNHRRNHTVQSLEIHRPTHPVEKVGLLSPGCIMGTLADHLLQSIHQIIPMRFCSGHRSPLITSRYFRKSRTCPPNCTWEINSIWLLRTGGVPTENHECL